MPFPLFPLLWWINRPACAHSTTHHIYTIKYESIHIPLPPPPLPLLIFVLISIPCMSLHSLPQNKSQSWIWQRCCDERSIDFWMVAVWLLYTAERRFCWSERRRSAHPNCFIVLGKLKWLLLKCSVNSALLLPPPQNMVRQRNVSCSVYSDTAVTMQQYSPSCFRTNYQQ